MTQPHPPLGVYDHQAEWQKLFPGNSQRKSKCVCVCGVCLLYVYIYGKVCMCAWVGLCMYVYMHRGQRKTSGVLLF